MLLCVWVCVRVCVCVVGACPHLLGHLVEGLTDLYEHTHEAGDLVLDVGHSVAAAGTTLCMKTRGQCTHK